MSRQSSIIYQPSKEEFLRACKKSDSYAEVLRSLGLHDGAGNYKTLKKRIREEGIDISHMGSTYRRKRPRTNLIPLSEVMIESSSYSRSSIKRRLISAGLLENKCQICSLSPEWNGKPLTLRIDHINGISNDNRLENLRIVCPNCDTQLDTYCSKNRSERAPIKFCMKCGIKISRWSKWCRSHSPHHTVGTHKTKIRWPKIEDIILRIKSGESILGISKSLGVSDNAVRKYLQRRSIDPSLIGLKKIRMPP